MTTNHQPPPPPEPLPPPPPRAPSPPAAYYVLLVAAGLTAVATLALAAWTCTIQIPYRNGPTSEAQIVSVLVVLAGGFAAAAALFGLAEILRFTWRTRRAVELLVATEGRDVDLHTQALATQAPGITTAQGEAIQQLLEDIRDNVLLTDDERHERRRQQVALERRQRTAQVEQAMASGLFHRARLLVQEMEQRLGGDEATRQLAARVDKTAGDAEVRDVAIASKQCEDLMGLTSWEQATRIAQDLADRHPTSEPAKELLARVVHERQLHEEQHRTRLFNEVQRCVSERQWRRALVAARELMGTYPGTSEAQTLASQRETLEANAQIEHRKELESRYKEYCETKRYAEALALARQVITEYPNSPQAQVMQAQLQHLEKQVKNPTA